jgi:hypothetical protein
MNAIILLLPLLLLVTPAIAHGQQATITAPQGTTINNATISVFQPAFLSGTWNFVNSYGNVSGMITFSNQDLCPSCKGNWQHIAIQNHISVLKKKNRKDILNCVYLPLAKKSRVSHQPTRN